MTTINGQPNQPNYSFDKKRVSKEVQAKVDTIASKDGKKGISSAQERAELQQLSQELAQTGNKHEQNYVMGLMLEYDTKAQEAETAATEKKQKNQVTPHAREVLKGIKKMVPGKNELNEAEAKMLLDEIKNTNGDYNAADIEYFKQELIKAGFGELLNEAGTSADPAKTETPAEPIKEEQPAEPVKTEPNDKQAEPSKFETLPKFKTPADPTKSDIDDNPKTSPTKPKPIHTEPPKNTKPAEPPKSADAPAAPAKNNKPAANNGLRFKQEDVANRAHLIVKASEVWNGTDEEMFIDNVTVGASRNKDGKGVADKYLHGRQPLNSAEAKAIDKQLRDATGKGLLQYMSEEFSIGGDGANDQFITQLYRQYITYGLRDE